MYDSISLNSSQYYVSDKSKHAYYVQNLFPENRTVYERMWRNMVQPDRPQLKIKYRTEKTRFTCRITKEVIQNCNICDNTSCYTYLE